MEKATCCLFWQFSKPCWQHTNSSNPTGLIAAELPLNKGIRLRLAQRMHSFTTLLLPQIGQLNWDHLLANKKNVSLFICQFPPAEFEADFGQTPRQVVKFHKWIERGLVDSGGVVVGLTPSFKFTEVWHFNEFKMAPQSGAVCWLAVYCAHLTIAPQLHNAANRARSCALGRVCRVATLEQLSWRGVVCNYQSDKFLRVAFTRRKVHDRRRAAEKKSFSLLKSRLKNGQDMVGNDVEFRRTL